MDELIKIGNQQISTKEYNGQRVVTFKDIDTVHERPDGTARKRFNDNKKRFIEGEDYFKISPSEFRTTIGKMDVRQQNDVTLITEQGYLMLAKSLTDDLAWKVQRDLVSTYFRVVKQKPLTLEQMMRIQLGMVDKHEERLDRLENTMNIDYAQQKQIKNFAAEVVVSALGGKDSKAYKHRAEDGSKISSQTFSRFWHDFNDYFNINAYANLPRVKFKEALEYINRWQPPTNMQLEIGKINRGEEKKAG